VPAGKVTETDAAGFVVGASPIHDQAVDDLRLEEVGRGLIHSEHVFAEIATIPLVSDPLGGKYEFVAGRENAKIIIVLYDIEKKPLVVLGAYHHGKIFDLVAHLSMQPYILMHAVSPW